MVAGCWLLVGAVVAEGGFRLLWWRSKMRGFFAPLRMTIFGVGSEVVIPLMTVILS